MEIIGRVTRDAIIKTTKGGKKVVEFNLAINEGYKPKNGGEYVDLTTFIRCSYWINEEAAKSFKKGAMMQLTGRIGIETYINKQQQAAGAITFTVTRYKTLVFAKRQDGQAVAAEAPQYHSAFTPDTVHADDDLPF